MPEKIILKEIVYNTLKDYPKTRDNRKLLYIKILRRYFPKTFVDKKKKLFEIEQLLNLPSYETITRIARQVQNSLGLYKPSDKVKQLRDELAKDYKQGIKVQGLNFFDKEEVW